MSETDNQTLDQTIDPPDNQGGTTSAASFDSGSTTDKTVPVDPPDNNGGTGG